MRFETAPLRGAWIIDLDRHVDERGFFARTFCAREFAEHGLPATFPQSNLSRNARAGTLRGMHFNTAAQVESKIVRCARGAIHDVIIDLRADSSTYRRWFAVELTADSGRALFVPEGFAHGFVTLVDDTDVEYQMGAFYAPEAARGLRWDDPAIGVEWPRPPTVISSRDATYPDFDPAVLDG
jgi:dTDP-4-dehydrorhamnose 3,5-epimerase